MEKSKAPTGVYGRCEAPLPQTAWLYCRVAHPTSLELEAQAAQLIAYAQEHGIEIAGITTETGNGLTLHRKGLDEASHALVTGKANILLVHSLCRIGRDTVEVSNYLMWLKQNGVTLTCADGTNPYPCMEVLRWLSDKCNIR